MKANKDQIQYWAERNKCMHCKRRFEQGFILPVTNPARGKFQPRFNVEAIYHLQDTHGLPNEITREWFTGLIYDLELTDFGAKGLVGLYDN